MSAIVGLGQITTGVAAGTGHRTQHLPQDARHWCRMSVLRVADALHQHHGVDTALTGMALGMDMLWAWAAHVIGLKLHAHIPFVQQPDVWPRQSDRAYWARVRGWCVEENIYGDLAGLTGSERTARARQLLHARNDGMIAAPTGVAVALWDARRRTGGTWSAVRKARRDRGLPVVHIDPVARTVGLLDDDLIGGV